MEERGQSLVLGEGLISEAMEVEAIVKEYTLDPPGAEENLHSNGHHS